MNVQKEVAKKQKRKAKRQKRGQRIQKRFRKRTRRYKARIERLKPFKKWWYSLNRDYRYSRQVNKVVAAIIRDIKREYIDSLLNEEPPFTIFPVTHHHSLVFKPEEIAVFQLRLIGMEGFSDKEKKHVLKALKAIDKLGGLGGVDLLSKIKDCVNTKYNQSYVASAIQYEWKEFGNQTHPYVLIEIKGPHPKPTL